MWWDQSLTYCIVFLYQINKLVLDEKVCDADPCQFILRCNDPSKSNIWSCRASSNQECKEWVSQFRGVLSSQMDFLRALQSPIAFQKEHAKDFWLIICCLIILWRCLFVCMLKHVLTCFETCVENKFRSQQFICLALWNFLFHLICCWLIWGFSFCMSLMTSEFSVSYIHIHSVCTYKIEFKRFLPNSQRLTFVNRSYVWTFYRLHQEVKDSEVDLKKTIISQRPPITIYCKFYLKLHMMTHGHSIGAFWS